MDPIAEDLFDALTGLGELRARRMFGGTGLYADDVFFGLIANDVVYFKVDDENVDAYRAAGCHPFRPFEGQSASPMGYWSVPLEALEHPATLLEWARAALAAASRRDASKARKKPRSPRKPR